MDSEIFLRSLLPLNEFIAWPFGVDRPRHDSHSHDATATMFVVFMTAIFSAGEG